MIKVFSSPNITEITLAQYLLDKAGIKYFLTDEQMSNIVPHYSIAIGGIKILVDNKDFEKAKEIIENGIIKNKKPIEKHVYTKNKEIKCPICKSENVELTKKPRPILTTIISFLFFLPIPINRKYYQCKKCKSFWNNKEISPKKLLIIFSILIILLAIRCFIK